MIKYHARISHGLGDVVFMAADVQKAEHVVYMYCRRHGLNIITGQGPQMLSLWRADEDEQLTEGVNDVAA